MEGRNLEKQDKEKRGVVFEDTRAPGPPGVGRRPGTKRCGCGRVPGSPWRPGAGHRSEDGGRASRGIIWVETGRCGAHSRVASVRSCFGYGPRDREPGRSAPCSAASRSAGQGSASVGRVGARVPTDSRRGHCRNGYQGQVYDGKLDRGDSEAVRAFRLSGRQHRSTLDWAGGESFPRLCFRCGSLELSAGDHREFSASNRGAARRDAGPLGLAPIVRSLCSS